MYKMNPEDIRRRNVEFLVHGKLIPFCQEARRGTWATEHNFPCAQPDVLSKARADFYNYWPPDGQPLDVAGLEAAFELAQKHTVTKKLDCKGCGTTLSKDNQLRGLCSYCSKPKVADPDMLVAKTDRVNYEQVTMLGERREEIRKILSAIMSMNNMEKYAVERESLVNALKKIEQRLRELNLGDDDQTRKLGPLPYELQQYHRAAKAAGLQHKFAYDGVGWFVRCHDRKERPPETAWAWLRACKEIYHVPRCCERFGPLPCGMGCAAQRVKACVTLDDYRRTV